ncbi:ankyrin repeat and SOCS box protein 18 [Carlito syrichta]|uniref:Ankyrin repeat and SOCS box protein 18 n=1 Tax=Carlito syrichta TaxID=1868482 RepID=A0A3Q0DXF1_CARSF|nr:ankyrin repeat and SOCS box protein 18 [Carlito syrichta]
MSNSDYLPDYPLNSDLVMRLKSALDAKDEERVRDLICTEVKPVDAVIELANDDWMKDPSAQLPPGVLLGDLEHLKSLTDQFFQDVNVVFEINKDEMEWQVKSPATFGLSGLWTLEYKRELTTPLCIAAAHGHTGCVRHLLGRGADPDEANSPGKRQPRRSGSGVTGCGRPEGRPGDPPWPPRRCAQALLEHGASVQREGGAGREDRPDSAQQPCRVYSKHTTTGHKDARQARLGRHGEASTEPPAMSQSTPSVGSSCTLNRYKGTVPTAGGHEAAIRAVRSALPRKSKRCHNFRSQHVDNARRGVIGISDHCARRNGKFMGLVKARNINTSKAHCEVLKTCASTPAVIEVLFNSYSQLCVSESWKEVIPEELFQMHKPFYQSLFALAHAPRCLQQLCRCALRKLFGKKCFCLIPLLPLPTSLQNYLLLEPEGVLH